MKKRIISIFLGVVTLVSLISVCNVSASAASLLTKGEKIAQTAVRYTHPHYNKMMSAGATVRPSKTKWKSDKGLQKYEKDHDKYIGKSDPYYASCDRLVCTSVRASGVDSKFPVGAVLHQYDYMDKSSKWQRVKSGSLKPGDIVLPNKEHIVIYVGRCGIQQWFNSKTAKKGYDFVAASFSDYFPKTVKYDTKISNLYAVFRAK